MSNRLTDRLASLKEKFTELKVTDVKVPENTTDLMTLIKANSAARSDQANEWSLDVFPNIIPIACYIFAISNVHANAIDHRNHAKSTAATVAMYHMACLYGFFLLNDMFVRPAPSAHARSWKLNTTKREFASWLLSLPVSEEMETIFAQFAATTPERTPNLFVVPTAAAFDHHLFFGRFIPLSFFSNLHDCSAELPGNTPKPDVLVDLFTRILYKCKHNVTQTTATFSCSIADIIGVTSTSTDDTNFAPNNSKFYQSFSSIFNPVLFRDYQRRSTLAPLSLATPVFNTTHPNAYDVLFSYTPGNIREIKIVLQAIQGLFASHIPCKKNLGQIITSGSGQSILHHGYSGFALPTWSSNPSTSFSTLKNFRRAIDAPTFANKLTFLEKPATIAKGDHASGSSFKAPQAYKSDDPSKRELGSDFTISNIKFPWFLINSYSSDKHYPDPSKDFISFDETHHATPRVLVFDISSSSVVDAHLATLSGKVIESYELDGSTVELPNIDKALGLQNSMFADSAIPFRYCIPGIKFYPRQTSPLPPVRARARPSELSRLPASSLLIDRLKIILPNLDYSQRDTTLPTSLPGFTTVDNVDWLSRVQSFIGFKTNDMRKNTDDDDATPGMANRQLYLWSPYSYVADEDDDDVNPDLSASRCYFITNFRTLFGTDVKLIEVKHIYEALPIA